MGTYICVCVSQQQTTTNNNNKFYIFIVYNQWYIFIQFNTDILSRFIIQLWLSSWTSVANMSSYECPAILHLTSGLCPILETCLSVPFTWPIRWVCFLLTHSFSALFWDDLLSNQIHLFWSWPQNKRPTRPRGEGGEGRGTPSL